ncbi:MAG: thioredoxin family protein [Myxococcota bacterium]
MKLRPLSPLFAFVLLACGSEAAPEPAEPASSGSAAAPSEPAAAPSEPSEDPHAGHAGHASAPTPSEGEGLQLGGSAPMADTAMRSVDDSRHSIGSVAGEKGTLVVFTCNHCPYAVAWQDRLVALAHEYMAQGIGVIAINSNDPNEYAIDSFEGMQARASELSMRFPYVVDETSDIARAFGAEKTPEAYLFDAEGHLVYHGAIDDSQDPATVQTHYLRDALAAVVAGNDVNESETRAVGCSIKFREV